MVLILQIAAGIVLGFVILQNLPLVFRFVRKLATVGMIGAAIVAAAVLAVLGLTAASKHWSEVGFLLGGLAGLALLAALVQCSARALGYLYVWQRARIARSRRWHNLIRLLGVHPSWYTTSLPVAQIASTVGDALFVGVWKLLFLYFLAMLAVLLLLIAAIGAMPLDQQKPLVVAALWVISALVPGVAVFLWISRRPRVRTTDGEATPPR